MKRWLLMILCLALLCTGCGKEVRTEDFRFVYREAEIGMNAEAGPVLYRLGEPMGCSQSPSCADAGMDTTYYHGGIYLTTSTVEGTERIARAWFADDTVRTGEGLKIGDSRSRAEELYGPEGFREDGIWESVRGNTRLIITFGEDMVDGIIYEAVHLGKE